MDGRSVPFDHRFHRPGGQGRNDDTFRNEQGVFFQCSVIFDQSGNKQTNRYSQANGAVYFRKRFMKFIAGAGSFLCQRSQQVIFDVVLLALQRKAEGTAEQAKGNYFF